MLDREIDQSNLHVALEDPNDAEVVERSMKKDEFVLEMDSNKSNGPNPLQTPELQMPETAGNKTEEKNYNEIGSRSRSLPRLQSPMISNGNLSARNRKYRSPMGRGGGSVDQGSPSPTNDPVKKLLRKIKAEKNARQTIANQRRLAVMREMDAKAEE